jgi:hypothetical protein
MTQATRVHSTPPTNTSAINPSGPVDPTRRHFLTVAAGGAVAAAIPIAVLAAAPAVDPVFDLIDTHREAHAAHMASLEVQNRFERRYGAGKGNWISEKPCVDRCSRRGSRTPSPACPRPCRCGARRHIEDAMKMMRGPHQS